MNASVHKGLVTGTVALLIFLMGYTTIDKLVNFHYFQSTLQTFPFIGPFSVWLSVAIPLIQTMLVASLLSRSWQAAGLVAAIAWLAVIILYMAVLLWSGKPLPCTCAGISEKLGWQKQLLINSGLLLLTWFAFYLHSRQERFIAINRQRQTPE